MPSSSPDVDPPENLPRVLQSDPAQLRRDIRAARSREDLARLLEVREKDLIYYTVRAKDARYRAFEIPKRSRDGGVRTILEPVEGLKLLQGKLLQILTALYKPPSCVHGFVLGRSIATNAQVHERNRGPVREVLKVDFQDFFGCINYGRVWGLLQSRAYRLSPVVATLIAQLVTHDNKLPQGAPTSPILANMVAARVDRELSVLAARSGIALSRFADDLTFSGPRIPSTWLSSQESRPAVDGELRAVIEANGFTIADQKTKLLRGRAQRMVTGLIVNNQVNVRRRYVRRIRAMLHAWERYGESAAGESWSDQRSRRPGSPPPSFRDVVGGMVAFVGMVRGVDDPVYNRLHEQYAKLCGFRPLPLHKRPWNHLRRADDAIWVIETAEGHGTVVLTDLGAVTCAHCIGPEPHIFHPRRPGVKYPVGVKGSDPDLDLALLDVPFEFPFRIPVVRGRKVSGEHEYQVMGYPDYNDGQTLVVASTREVGRRTFSGISRILIGYSIAKGMSGGALIDRQGRLEGVLATHTELYNSVIPSDTLWVLRGLLGLD